MITLCVSFVRGTKRKRALTQVCVTHVCSLLESRMCVEYTKHMLTCGVPECHWSLSPCASVKSLAWVDRRDLSICVFACVRSVRMCETNEWMCERLCTYAPRKGTRLSLSLCWSKGAQPQEHYNRLLTWSSIWIPINNISSQIAPKTLHPGRGPGSEPISAN